MAGKRVEFFKKVMAFKGVSDEGIERLSQIFKRVEFNAGDVIIKEGEEGDTVYIIDRGLVEVSMSITLAGGIWDEESGAIEKVLVKLGPGAMFGEMAFIYDDDQRSATIVALEDCSLLETTSRDFQEFAEQDLASAYRIILNIAKIIADRLRRSNADMKKLTTVLTIALRKPRLGDRD